MLKFIFKETKEYIDGVDTTWLLITLIGTKHEKEQSIIIRLLWSHVHMLPISHDQPMIAYVGPDKCTTTPSTP